MIHRNNGPIASRLRQRKFQLLRRFAIPADALPGSLSLSHLRCGKPTCHCADDRGHPVWSLTYMVQGKKRVQHIPKELVEENVNGVVTKSHDVEDLARAIRDLVNDKRKRHQMSRQARQAVIDRSWPGAFRKFWAATEI